MHIDMYNWPEYISLRVLSHAVMFYVFSKYLTNEILYHVVINVRLSASPCRLRVHASGSCRLSMLLHYLFGQFHLQVFTPALVLQIRHCWKMMLLFVTPFHVETPPPLAHKKYESVAAINFFLRPYTVE